MSEDVQRNNILHAVVEANQLEVLRFLLFAKVLIKLFPDILTGPGAKSVRYRDGRSLEQQQFQLLLTSFNSARLTPLMLAVLKGNEEIVQLLAATETASHINLTQFESANTALHLAVLANRPCTFAVVQALLQSRPLVNLKNCEGKTALLIAQTQEMIDVVDELEPFEDFECEDIDVRRFLNRMKARPLQPPPPLPPLWPESPRPLALAPPVPPEPACPACQIGRAHV